MTISAGEFARFLNTLNPGYRCPFCNNETFSMNVQATDLVADLAVTVQSPGIAPTMMNHNFYARSCQRCGHTDWYHKAAVQRWLGSSDVPGELR